MRRFLFVCVENSNRSQMAEAFAKIFGGAAVESYSAGSSPSGKVNPRAIRFMKEVGYDLTKHHSKSVDDVRGASPFDAVVTMGCGDACPWMPAKVHADWNIPDPKDLTDDEFRNIRDDIRRRVMALLKDS